MSRRHVIAYAAVLGILVAAAASLNATLSAFNIHIQKKPIYPESGLTLASMPREVPGFTLVYEQPPLPKEIQKELGTDNYMTRRYVEADPADGAKPRSFEVHLAYYTGMIDTVPHVPERCFVGSGGFRIDALEGVTPVPIDLDRFPLDPDVDHDLHGVIRRGRTGPDSDTPGLRVRMPLGIEHLKMNITRFADNEGRTTYAGYFFVANGGIAPRAEDVRGLAFSSQATHAYYMKVQFTSGDVADAAGLASLAGAFLDEAFPDLMRRTPDWVDVTEGRHPATRATTNSPADSSL